MMKKLISALLLVATTTVWAQKIEEPVGERHDYDGDFARIHYFNYQLSQPQDTIAIAQHLRKELQLGPFDQLKVTHIAKSLSATHITFQQYHNNTLILGAKAKVAVNPNNELFRCIETVFSNQQRLPNLPVSIRNEDFFTQYSDVKILQNEPAYLYHNQQVVPGWYTRFTAGSTGHFEATWFVDGSRYFVRDLNSYYNHEVENPDSLVAVYVFDPDPISPIGVVYGGIYIDQNDDNESILNPLRFLQQIKVHYSNNLFELKSDFVEIKEFSNPVYPIVNSTTPFFDFSRSHHGFEQVNCYYHITKYQEYLQNIGYNLVNYSIHVDAQGFNGQDNSSFSWGFNPPRLTFGEGGVDDGEDADVIVHEYGHAISHSASPMTNSGTQRSTLDEAIGDYFAVSYKKNEVNFGNDKVFNWDGHNPFWPGRTVNNPQNFNYKNITFNSIYTYTTLWNAAMFDIYNQLGKTYTDKLQIEAAYSFASQMTFTQSALTILDADQTMSGGTNQTVIRNAFVVRGILDPLNIDENSPHFKRYELRNNVAADDKTFNLWLKEQAYVEIYNLSGVGVYRAELNQGTNLIQPGQLAAGMYLMRIYFTNELFTERIIVATP